MEDKQHRDRTMGRAFRLGHVALRAGIRLSIKWKTEANGAIECYDELGALSECVDEFSSVLTFAVC